MCLVGRPTRHGGSRVGGQAADVVSQRGVGAAAVGLEGGASELPDVLLHLPQHGRPVGGLGQDRDGGLRQLDRYVGNPEADRNA